MPRRFAYMRPRCQPLPSATTPSVIEAAGRYLVPGLCDGHMHVESGMVTVTEFARAVMPHGTTSMFIDPHEIANVLGLPGVRLMHDEAVSLPINVFVQMPSCVPSAPGLENAGAAIGAEDVARGHDAGRYIIGLGEMMNYPGVVGQGCPDARRDRRDAERPERRWAATMPRAIWACRSMPMRRAAQPTTTKALAIEDAIARVRQGMRAMLRLGSAWYDVAAQIKAVTERGLDPRNFILCTDDSHCRDA